MNDSKPFWTSKTMWGGVIAFVCTILQTTGLVTVSAEDQATIADILVQVPQYAGILIAIWGRYTAKTEVTFFRS